MVRFRKVDWAIIFLYYKITEKIISFNILFKNLWNRPLVLDLSCKMSKLVVSNDMDHILLFFLNLHDSNKRMVSYLTLYKKQTFRHKRWLIVYGCSVLKYLPLCWHTADRVYASDVSWLQQMSNGVHQLLHLNSFSGGHRHPLSNDGEGFLFCVDHAIHVSRLLSQFPLERIKI